MAGKGGEMDRPWTSSRGPVIANELDLVKAGAINAMLSHDIAILPTQPGDPIRPLAIGLWVEIRALLRPEGGVTALRRATGAYLHSKRYYFATAQPDSMRHDIDGNPIEPVTASDRLAAQQRFLSLGQNDSNRETPAPEAPPPPPIILSKAEMIRASLLRK
jgi:hypothetical protein